MANYAVSTYIAKFGAFASFLSNFILIYLTIFYIRNVFGTYKRMTLGFALSGIFFSGFEIIAKPFAHNFNGSLLFFSLNFQLSSEFSQLFVQIILALWAGFYMETISLIAIQFVFRLLCLHNSTKTKYFNGYYSVFWMVYPIMNGFLVSAMFYLLCQPDEYSDEYVRQEVVQIYGLNISDIPRFLLVPYSESGTLRIPNFLFLISSSSLVFLHYAIIIYCGLKMNSNMKKELKKFSSSHQKLQHQLFKALVVQSIGPTFLLVIPSTPTLLGPFINPLLRIEVSLQTGWLYPIVGLYPTFDSVAFMLIVTEYKKILKGRFQYFFSGNTPSQSNQSVFHVRPSTFQMS